MIEKVIKKMKGLLPKQKEVSGWLGGFSFLLRRTAFYFSLVNYLMVSHVFYVTSPAVREIFGSYWIFLIVLGLGLAALMIFEYVIMLPSLMRFQQTQYYKEDRSPLYDRLDEIERKIEGEAGGMEREKDGDT